MLRSVYAETADDAWRDAHGILARTIDAQRNTQKGNSREIHHVAFSIRNPLQRWVTSRTPPINPAFSVAEVVWILQGRSDIKFLENWNSQLSKFTGPGPELHGSYGNRLRSHLGVDQLTRAYEVLQSVPLQRQVVLQIWDGRIDLPRSDGTPQSMDIPCNIISMLKIVDGALDWTQIMRSNDLMLGLPYNFIQWMTIQEILAGWLRIKPGEYHHVSDSLHVYDRDNLKYGATLAIEGPPQNLDDLRLEYDASKQVFRAMEKAIEKLADRPPNVVEAEHTVSDLPTGYANLLRLVAAEAYRRSHEKRSMNIVASSIDNPILEHVWNIWKEHVSARG